MSKNILKDKELDDMIKNLVIPEQNKLYTSEYLYIRDINDESDKIKAAYRLGYGKCRRFEYKFTKLDQICTDLEFANDLFKIVRAGVSEYAIDDTVEYALYSLWDRYDCLIKQLRDTLKNSVQMKMLPDMAAVGESAT